MSRKNWIAVASAEHARRGSAEPLNGFMQVCHGKCAPLQRVSPGDLVAYYAPTQRMGGGDRLQAFVSLGVVQPGAPYALDMGDGFKAFRRDVAYVAAEEVSILPLLEQFDFVEDPQRWGYKFRFGLFDISDHDIRMIARAMRADLAALGLETRLRLSRTPAAQTAGASSLRQASLSLS
ncbi:EVE domain-containing protein [Polaromonas sp. YR568]|uniref:EVE domain-containing protein n=1 Tax=Polaromonas sp. YR568 TaxID=1855301 RepID=UPI0008E3C0EA|nr:EVE domain-containing protein [Polaromonas sp. YR568]SFU74469.1 EVE domain-containing protein [Polaromonas sp. YR568]